MFNSQLPILQKKTIPSNKKICVLVNSTILLKIARKSFYLPHPQGE